MSTRRAVEQGGRHAWPAALQACALTHSHRAPSPACLPAYSPPQIFLKQVLAGLRNGFRRRRGAGLLDDEVGGPGARRWGATSAWWRCVWVWV